MSGLILSENYVAKFLCQGVERVVSLIGENGNYQPIISIDLQFGFGSGLYTPAYSGPNRPLIPIESGHLFRGKPAGDSGAK